MIKTKIQRVTNNKSEIFVNKVHIGDFIRDVDGYFYFVPNKPHDLWTGYQLRLIADLLDKENEEWNKIVAESTKSNETNENNA